MTSRHANDPETPLLRVLACTKCGDRHTVDIGPILEERKQALLAELHTVWIGSGSILRDSGGPYDPAVRMKNALIEIVESE